MCKALFEAELFDENEMREIALSDWKREEGDAVEESKSDYVSGMNEVPRKVEDFIYYHSHADCKN
jgi:hypothetical protein